MATGLLILAGAAGKWITILRADHLYIVGAMLVGIGTVVQWLRFGGGGYMQIVGIARADAWKDAYPRFRSVRDGIEGR
jgi:hypothetical protein